MNELTTTYSLTAQKLLQEFSLLSSWELRYKKLLSLSHNLVDLNDHQQQRAYLVRGCENRVWLIHEITEDGTLLFNGKSDSRIVQGILSILISLVNGLTPQQITDLDIQAYLTKLNFSQRLSLSRQQGLLALINSIKQLAQQPSSAIINRTHPIIS